MKPHIVVCVKSVMLHAPAGKIVRTADSCELNPFDRPALTAARYLQTTLGADVTALCMGPPSAAATLYEAIAMGADRGVLLSDPRLAGSDTLATSTALAAAIKRLLPVDWLIFGTRTADSDTGQVGPQCAVLLDLPMVTGVTEIRLDAGGARLERLADGFCESFRISAPGALTIDQRSFQAAPLGLAQVGAAFEEGKIDTWGLEDLGLEAHQVGDAGSPTRVASLTRQARSRTCEFLTGEADEMADELIRRLAASGQLV